MAEDLRKRFGGAALVTGASSGFGEQFALQLAEAGLDVILVARREELLKKLAQRIERSTNVRTLVVCQDLTEDNAAASLETKIEEAGWSVGLLVNNAGYGFYGEFIDAEEASEAGMVDLNCRALVTLSRRFAPAMVKRGKGGIIMVASMAAYQSVPYLATYGATKAFALSFGEALWAELKPHGVEVLSLCPGYVDTGFQAVANSASMPKMGAILTPQEVVQTALKALGKKPSVVPGVRNKFLALSPRLLPRHMATQATAGLFKPKKA
jgi:uncharacterized protein